MRLAAIIMLIAGCAFAVPNAMFPQLWRAAQAEVSSIVVTEGLIAYYRPSVTLDGSDYFNAHDGYNITNVSFSGDGAFVQNTNSTLQHTARLTGTQFSVVGWFKVLTNGTTSRAILFGSAADLGGTRTHYIGTADAHSPYIQIVKNDGNYFYQEYLSGYAATNVWEHLAFTRNGTNIIAYRDGVALVPSTRVGAATNHVTATAVAATIGYNNVSHYRAYIDFVRIYTNAITSNQVVEIYDSENKDGH